MRPDEDPPILQYASAGRQRLGPAYREMYRATLFWRGCIPGALISSLLPALQSNGRFDDLITLFIVAVVGTVVLGLVGSALFEICLNRRWFASGRPQRYGGAGLAYLAGTTYFVVPVVTGMLTAMDLDRSTLPQLLVLLALWVGLYPPTVAFCIGQYSR